MLQLRGFAPQADLVAEFTRDGSYYTSHANHRIPGVELSTGSLGHALGVACGVALAGKRKERTYTVFAVLSDGELDEGSNWEAFLFAPQHRLDNLTVIVDYNKIQSFGRTDEVLSLDPLADKFSAFNWQVTEINGHDHGQILSALAAARADRKGRPKIVIAHTVKGKGVSFMEDRLAWRYKSPTEAVLAAKAELEGN